MFELKKTALIGLAISSLALSGCLGGGGSDDDDDVPQENRVREQQKRMDTGFFTPVQETAADFTVLRDEAPYNTTDRWVGVLDGAAYRIEVPEDWNGMLVMYAHGFRTTDVGTLRVDNAPMREYLLDNGYAWAASSYSTNFYDVRTGVEDTNALALAFTNIAAENGRALETPDKYYITGVSMGGHVTAAAIEKETKETANHVVNYSGAAPMCGVVGDTELFNFFAGYTISLIGIAESPSAVTFPLSPSEATAKLTTARAEIWNNYAANPGKSGLTEKGDVFYQALKNLSGGERPMYDVSFGLFQNLLQGFSGSDGSVDGVLIDNVVDTNNITYRYESELDEPLTTDEINFNSMIVKVDADENANALRDDGLRWIPKVNGEFDVKVVTSHTIGDLFVPILMEQQYRQRAEENGNGDLLVQRAIRAPGHCDFTQAEFENTLDAMLKWEQDGIKPAGDDWLTPATVADENFGCTFTVDGPVGDDNYPRALLAPCLPTVPAI